MNKKDKYRLSYKKSMLDDLKLGQLDNDYKKIIENYSIKKNDMKPVKMSKYDEKNIITGFSTIKWRPLSFLNRVKYSQVV